MTGKDKNGCFTELTCRGAALYGIKVHHFRVFISVSDVLFAFLLKVPRQSRTKQRELAVLQQNHAVPLRRR